MRSATRLSICCTFFVVLASTMGFAQGAKVTTENRELRDNERDNPAERARWFMRGRTFNGKPAPELLHRAYQQKLNNRALNASKESAVRTNTTTTVSGANSATTSAAQPVLSFTPTVGGASWVPLGPAPSGTASVGDVKQDYGPAIGRATVVVIDQTDANGNTVYLGGASGGLWKSINAADPTVQNCNLVSISQAPYCGTKVTWTPLIDQQATLTVGAMAIRPGNNQWLLVGTGEANNSSDSYYGLGFLLSKDGGATWSSNSTAKDAAGTGTIDLHGLGTSKIAFSTDNPSLVVASMAAASGGIAVGAEFGGGNARGIYFSTDAGQNWQRATVHDAGGVTPDAGSSNTVLYNPFTHSFFADVRWHGLYTSTDGQNWTRLPNTVGTLNLDSNCPATVATNNTCPLYRSVLTMVPNRAGPNNKGEMYLFVVDANDTDQGIYQSMDGGQSWTTFDISGLTNCGDSLAGSCGTVQGTYNLTLAAVPNGTTATDVYAGAVNQFRCNWNPVSNPTCSSSGFANLTHTYGDCGGLTYGAFAHVHPDQHGIDFSTANPQLMYFANDGGVYRTLNGFDTTRQTCNSVSQPWIQYDNLSGTMGSMIQFVWFTQHPTDPAVAFGGTQDNGTMARNSGSPSTTYGTSWQSINNGDGGFTDMNPTNTNEWFVSNPKVDISECVNSGGITCTADTFTQIIQSSTLGGDKSTFYTPYMLDPQAANHMLVGTCRLWRVERPASNTGPWSSATPLTYNLDSFSVAGTSACADSAANKLSAIAAGGPCKGVCNSGTNGTGNGSQVIYVGTEAGKLFVTTNADGGPSTWFDRSAGLNNTTGCGGSGCTVSGIAIDARDPSGQTAYATVMGFKTGHVFKTTNAGSTWTNLDGNAGGSGLPDNPADAVAIDPNVANLIYVATDVGVFKSLGDQNWQEVGPTTGAGSLPNVAATAVKVFGSGASTKLRVSTYGRGLWEIPIPNVPGFQLVVNPGSLTASLNQTATFTGSITPYNNFNSQVNVSCVASGTAQQVPQTCMVSPSTLASGSFTVTVSNPTAGDFTFNIVAVGQDLAATTNQTTVTFHAALTQRYSLSQPANASAPAGSVAATSLNLTADSSYSGTVTMACGGLPAGASCSFSPATVLSPGQTINVAVSIATGIAAVGSYPITITASSADALTQTANLTLNITVPPDFTLGTIAAQTVHAGDPAQATFTVGGNSTFNSSLTFACTGVPVAAGPCSFSPATVLLGANQNTTVTLDLPTTATTPQGTYTVIVTATPASGTAHSQAFTLTVGSVTTSWNLTSTPINPAIVKAGQQTIANITVNSPGTFAGTVNLSCAFDSTAGAVGTSRCTLNPSSVTLTAQSSQSASVTVDTTGAPATNPRVIVTAADAANTSRSVGFTYAVTDFTVAATTPAAFTVGNTATETVTLSGQNNYQGTVGVQCSATGLTCTLNASTVQLTSAAPTATLTATLSGPAATDANSGGAIPVTITAADTGFAALTHPVTSTATLQNYKIAASPTAAVVTAGQSATIALNTTVLGGYAGRINFDANTICSGLPSLTTCAIDNNTFVNGAGTVTLTIKTTASTTSALRPPVRPGAPLFAFWTMTPGAFGVVLLAGAGRKRKMWLLLGLALALVITMSACGGGGGGSTTPPPPTVKPGTPAGTYTVTLTGASTSGTATLTRSTTINLTVQ